MIDKKRGSFPNRQTWYSLCSKHQTYDPDCDTCKQGEWVNDIGHLLSYLLWKALPRVWLWWQNRKHTKH